MTFNLTEGDQKMPINSEKTGNKQKDSGNDKTVKIQRCPKHRTFFLPDEGCPECAKEVKSSGS